MALFKMYILDLPSEFVANFHAVNENVKKKPRYLHPHEKKSVSRQN